MSDVIETQANATPATELGHVETGSTEPSLQDRMLAQATELLAKPDDGDEPSAEETAPAKAETDKARSKDGKFAVKTDPADDKKETPQAAKPAPAHWSMSTDAKERWAGLSPEQQDLVVQLANQDRQRLGRVGNELKAAQSAVEPFKAVERQEAAYFKQIGQHPAQVLANNVAWNKLFLSDPDRAFPALAKQLGYDLSKLISQSSARSATDANGLPVDPEMTALMEANKALTDRLARIEGQQRGIADHLTQRQQADADAQAKVQQQQMSTLRSRVDAFAAENPDFADVEDDIAEFIPILRSRGVPEDQLLQEAFTRAVRANPATFEKVLNTKVKAAIDERIEPVRRAAQDAKRAGAVNVRSAPATPPPPSLADARNDVLRRHGLIS